MSFNEQRSGNEDIYVAEASCRECKHLIVWPYCFAFMTGSGIPAELREGKCDHSQPFPGDHGIRFLQKDSPYELSETALKNVMAMYSREILMPNVEVQYQELGNQNLFTISKDAEQKKAPADLMEACITGNIEAAKEFLAHGDDINSRDAQGNTPLMHACRNCHLELVRLLLENGCDTTVTDRYSKQAIDIAKDWGYPSIVELMNAYIADEQ